MKVLALTDGSVQALQALSAFDGLVAVNTHVLPNRVPQPLRDADIVVIALASFPGSSLNKMVGWLLSQRIESIPRIICLPPDDLARLSGELRASNTKVLSMPVDPEAILEAVETLDKRFKKIRNAPRRRSATAVQSLSRTFGGLLGSSNANPEDVVKTVGAATDEVSDALDNEGLGPWLDSVASYHSYTARHCMAVAGFAAQWSRAMGVEEGDHRIFTRGALLHDVGKMAVPLSILDKPGRLTDDEFKVIKSHPVESKVILEATTDADPLVIDLAYHHHEMLDGSGYPEGLSGDQINDMVRCLTIIDIYSALIDARSYKASMTPDEAYAELQSMRGKLDLDLVGAFSVVVEEHKQHLLREKAA
ncbi:MAG: HD domain-containing protein [Devosiaceae bacterium]|nr:HD domain-containing protein [Devosiaceae bacterium MH13]